MDDGWTRHHRAAVWRFVALVASCAVVGWAAGAVGLCRDGSDVMVVVLVGVTLMDSLLNGAELRAREGRGG